jgi:hypothetical protein
LAALGWQWLERLPQLDSWMQEMLMLALWLGHLPWQIQ